MDMCRIDLFLQCGACLAFQFSPRIGLVCLFVYFYSSNVKISIISLLNISNLKNKNLIIKFKNNA